MPQKIRPGQVRDAIFSVLSASPDGVPLPKIEAGVRRLLGDTPSSSIRSYLRLNTPRFFSKGSRGVYSLRESEYQEYGIATSRKAEDCFEYRNAKLVFSDCFEWLSQQNPNSIHAIVTDPPYGLFEYSEEQKEKLRTRNGGVWRIPPSFDGVQRAPLPRFTTLREQDLLALEQFFFEFGKRVLPVLVPGANIVIASNPLVSYIVSGALVRSGLERRGEIIRLVMTMRGGDRPKDAHEEFSGVSVMPRSMWEPWLLFRKPLEGRAQDNLRKWKVGGFRRPSEERPFGDVIQSSPTHKAERDLAPHPSLKPQQFLRVLVRGVLPLGQGIVLDPFAGSGSTLAAAEAVGYSSLGVEKDRVFYEIAKKAIPKLLAFKNGLTHSFNL